MSGVVAVLTKEPRARLFLLACLESSVGTGAATVGLVILAYDRLHSPWAITLVLLAEWVPSMFAGPLFGAAVDRWSRRGCAVAADLLSAAAFIGLGFVDTLAATLALALVAGIGISLWSPAVLAALPSLVAPDRRSAVTSLFGAVRDAGRTLGPVVAALLFPLVGTQGVMVVNGATFLASALVLATISFGAREEGAAVAGTKVLAEAREGLTVIWRLAGVRIILWASSAVFFAASMVNVGELLLARKIGAGGSGYAVLVAAAGGGIALGSLLGARGGELHELKRRYVLAALLMGLAVVELALSHAYAAAFAGFLAMGIGNGLVIVHERLILQAAVPPRLIGRAYAVFDMLSGWGFAASFIAAGALIATLGTRATFGIAGAIGVGVAVLTGLGLRGVWRPPAKGPSEARPVAPLERDPEPTPARSD